MVIDISNNPISANLKYTDNATYSQQSVDNKSVPSEKSDNKKFSSTTSQFTEQELENIIKKIKERGEQTQITQNAKNNETEQFKNIKEYLEREEAKGKITAADIKRILSTEFPDRDFINYNSIVDLFI